MSSLALLSAPSYSPVPVRPQLAIHNPYEENQHLRHLQQICNIIRGAFRKKAGLENFIELVTEENWELLIETVRNREKKTSFQNPPKSQRKILHGAAAEWLGQIVLKDVTQTKPLKIIEGETNLDVAFPGCDMRFTNPYNAEFRRSNRPHFGRPIGETDIIADFNTEAKELFLIDFTVSDKVALNKGHTHHKKLGAIASLLRQPEKGKEAPWVDTLHVLIGKGNRQRSLEPIKDKQSQNIPDCHLVRVIGRETYEAIATVLADKNPRKKFSKFQNRLQEQARNSQKA